MIVKPSLRELTSSSIRKILDSTQPVSNIPGKLGLRVNLQKDPQKGATLITTAEAICALAPHKSIEQQRFQQLIEGLQHLWLEHSQSSDLDSHLNNRHIGWYLLAMIEADQGEYVREGLTELLKNSPKPGEPWTDAPNRQHEVYSTWIMTWALLSAVKYLKNRDYAQYEDLVRLATEGLKYLVASLKNELGFGAAFTNVKGDHQHHEGRPNPAMTAYILSLLPLALETPSLNLPDKFFESENILESYTTLAGWENRRIWDSYREPYQPGSKEGDFEHFTTCWVARAFWLALTSGIAAKEETQKRFLWLMAKAIKGLLELRVQDEKYEGLIYVDRGSLKDYSFAISDFLMLLNLIASERLPDSQVHTYPEDILERLIKTADIDILIDDVSSFAGLSAAYTSYEVIIDGFKKEAQKEGAKVNLLKNKMAQLEAMKNISQTELENIDSQVQHLKTAKAGYFETLNAKWGTSFTVVFLDYWDGISFLLIAIILGIVQGTTMNGVIGVTILTIGIMSALFCGVALSYDIVNRFRNARKVLPLEASLFVLWAVATVSFSVAFCQELITLSSEKVGFLGILISLFGGTVFVASAVYNYKRHRKKWAKWKSFVNSENMSP